MKNIICIMLACLHCFFASAQSAVNDSECLENCDLLFHIPENDNDITDVTYDGKSIKADHVAMFLRIEGVPLVIDATSRGVALRSADSLLAEKGQYIMVRVACTDAHYTIKNALSMLGRPYDYKFGSGDDEIYCSELIQKCYVDSDGRRIFKTIPMSFRDNTGRITEYWKEYYYSRWKLSVPDGEEGSNPADIYTQAITAKR